MPATPQCHSASRQLFKNPVSSTQTERNRRFSPYQVPVPGTLSTAKAARSPGFEGDTPDSGNTPAQASCQHQTTGGCEQMGDLEPCRVRRGSPHIPLPGPFSEAKRPPQVRTGLRDRIRRYYISLFMRLRGAPGKRGSRCLSVPNTHNSAHSQLPRPYRNNHLSRFKHKPKR